MKTQKDKAWEDFVKSGTIQNYLEYKGYSDILNEGIKDGLKATMSLNTVETKDINEIK